MSGPSCWRRRRSSLRDAVRDGMRAIYDDANEAEGGAMRVQSEYLLTMITVS